MLAAIKSTWARMQPNGEASALALSSSFLKKITPILLLAVALTALVMMWMWHDQSGFKPVFGAQEKIVAADMMAVLDAEHIPYRLHPDTGQVLVPEASLGKVRMLLASKGVVAKLPAGLELMDKNDPLGVSQFVQDVRFRRGLEGELAQSIMTLDPIQSARVHLSIAKSSSFVSADGEKSTASVVLNLKPGQKLNKEQTAAIINMVAGSVASLDPQRVTVVDQAGNFLSSHVDLSDGAGINTADEAETRYRDETLRNIRDLLEPTLGANNFKATVTAVADNDKIDETRERYGEAPKVTNEATRDEAQPQGDPALGVPGSLSNRPLQINASAPAGAVPGQASKKAATRQYAYDKDITQIKHARGGLKKLSVSVVLNNAAAPKGGWTPAQLANIDKILRNGLGIDAARGDVLAVSTLSFPAVPEETPWWMERDTLASAGSYAAAALAMLLSYLFIARPLIRLLQQRYSRQEEAELREIDPPLAITEQELEREGGADTAEPKRLESMPVVPLLESYDLPPEGSSVDVLVDHLKKLADKEPARVAEVIKQWVQKRNG